MKAEVILGMDIKAKVIIESNKVDVFIGSKKQAQNTIYAQMEVKGFFFDTKSLRIMV